MAKLKQDFSSKLATDKIYFMILEALMISLLVVLLKIFSPGVACGRDAYLYVDKSFRGWFAGLNDVYTEKHAYD